MTNTKKTAAPSKGAASSSKKTPTKKTSQIKSESVEKTEDQLTEEKPQVQAEESVVKDITVVIPYLSSAAAGDELKYALRAWDQNFLFFNVVVIGDREDWFGKEIKHIAHRPESKNPQVDVAHKLMTAIASKEVSDQFILTNDDIYTLCQIGLDDITVLKSHGKLRSKGAVGGLYHENAARTIAALKKEGFDSPYDFATHTPIFLEKEMLAEVIKKFNCDKEGHLISSLYFNLSLHGRRPIITRNDTGGSIAASVYKPNPNLQILEEVLKTRKWINHDNRGWKPLEPYLKKLFPNKSRFEK